MGREAVRFLDLIITEQCNSRCKICSIWREGAKSRNELSFEDVKKVLDSKCLKDIGCVDISGGEPFLRQDLAEIVKLVHSKLPRARLSISTNALEPENILESLAKINEVCNIDLRISLDGLEKTHNFQRGIKDAFQRVMKTIELISKKFPKQAITFIYTISPWNYEDILKTYKLVKSLNQKYNFLVTYAHNVANYKNFLTDKREADYKGMFKFSEEQISAIKGQLERLFGEYIKEKDFANALFVNQIPLYLEKDRHPTFFCNVPFKMALILPSKLVYNCVMMDSIGDLSGDNMDAVLNSDTAKKNKETCSNGKCNGCMLFIGNHISYPSIAELFGHFLDNNILLEKKEILELSLSEDSAKNLSRILSAPKKRVYCSFNFDGPKESREKLKELIKNAKRKGKEVVITKPLPRCITGMDANFMRKYASMPSSCRDCHGLFAMEEGTIAICPYIRDKNLLNYLDNGADSFFDKTTSQEKDKGICADCSAFNRIRCHKNPCY